MSLASRGLRDMDDGTQRIEDEAELRAVRAQARRVKLQSVVLALVGTALAFLLPV